MYDVVYLQHSIFHDCERVEGKVTQAELTSLLHNGMITLLSAERCPV